MRHPLESLLDSPLGGIQGIESFVARDQPGSNRRAWWHRESESVRAGLARRLRGLTLRIEGKLRLFRLLSVVVLLAADLHSGDGCSA